MRYLMIDRVIEWTPFRQLVAVKNVSLESDVLEHHFPGYPLFPGALTLEAMAQAAGYLVMRSLFEERNTQHGSQFYRERPSLTTESRYRGAARVAT